MSKMIQIRNVPEGLHRKLKSRAALEGVSLSDYLLNEIAGIAEKPTLAELTRRIEEDKAQFGGVDFGPGGAAAWVRADRERH